MFVPADMFYVFFLIYLLFFVEARPEIVCTVRKYHNDEQCTFDSYFFTINLPLPSLPMSNQLYSFCLAFHCANSALWAIRRQRPKY